MPKFVIPQEEENRESKEELAKEKEKEKQREKEKEKPTLEDDDSVRLKTISLKIPPSIVKKDKKLPEKNLEVYITNSIF